MAVAIPVSRRWLSPLIAAYRVPESVCLLPVVAVWFVLYRWSPNPP